MLHEVNFQEWCPKCEHFKRAEHEDPCHDCLNEPVNDDSRKPVMFKAADKGDDGGKGGRGGSGRTDGKRRVSVTGKPI